MYQFVICFIKTNENIILKGLLSFPCIYTQVAGVWVQTNYMLILQKLQTRKLA